MIILTVFTITIPVLLCVAFFTLAERQIMASMQRRFGPHVSGLGGVLQPF
jgi:NADH:ubiquinone oxidoreductase subunit H